MLVANNLKIEYCLMIRRNNLSGGLMIRRVFTRIEMIRNTIEGDQKLPGSQQILLSDVQLQRHLVGMLKKQCI